MAPMDGVTDFCFREIIAGLHKPDVLFTEFTSADGLCSKGREITLKKLKYSERQRPIVAQIWGTNPKNLYTAARIVQDLGFDGVDINMGCPVKEVVKRGGGAALIKDKNKTREIIDAVISGAGALPVSVKTRIGFNKVETEGWISFLLTLKLQALTIHGRTAAQKSKGLANWEEIGKARSLRDQINPETIIIGNGDVKSYTQAVDKHERYGVDGVMIAEGIFSNPWVFEKTLRQRTHSKKESLQILRGHIRLFDETWGDSVSFGAIRKYLTMYVKGFLGAKRLRTRLMAVESRLEAEKLLSQEQLV